MEKLIDAFADRDFFPVWVTGKGPQIMGNIPESPHYGVYRRIVEEDYPGIYYGDESRPDSEVFELASEAIEEATTHDHFCCFIHFRNPDSSGHRNKNYETFVEDAWGVDEYIWDLMQILPEETDIIYCSDHGFDFVGSGDLRNGHRFSPQGMLATSFRIRKNLSVCQHSIGRLIYRKAGQDPDHTLARPKNTPYKMYGTDLI